MKIFPFSPSDADSAEITTEWSTVTFALDVKKESSLKEIKLTVNGATSVDFDYINIDTRINKTDKDSVTPSADGTVVLPPLEVDMNDNLLTEAISEHNLPYWSYGDQKLTLKEDENGELYFAASGIKDSAEGFIYKPGFIIKPGTYTFKATIRTAVEGEKQRYRIMVGDLSMPAVIGDEWTTISSEFTVTDEMEFTLKFRGGSSKLNILDYEFKDISFTNVIVEYLGKDVFENGDFNDKDAALETWTFGRSSGVLTVVNDGDNNFLRVSEKVDSNAAIDAKTGHTAFVGVKYKISYDIRTSNAGETMQARTDAVAGGKTAELNDANGVRFFEVTDQWQTVEHIYTPEAGGDLILRIAGGWRGEPDNKDFDIDNVKIEVIG
ncbi:MAG: hypothetical protein IJY93_01015 [Clostridia bacterium]|nr:hypothetical protein [Clostridia bacterium]